MTRFVPVTVLVMLAASGVARAQTTLPGGAVVNFDKLYIHENGNKDPALASTPEALYRYFNLAHCQCSKEMPGFIESTFGYLLTVTPAGLPPISEQLQIWVGAGCSTDQTTRNTNCTQISSQSPQISAIQASNGTTIAIPIFNLMNPEPTATDCQARPLSATVWGLADAMVPPTGKLDYSSPKSIDTDAQPPPLPTNLRAFGGDGAVQISWTPNVDTADVFAYQALCARADPPHNDERVKTSGRPPQRYMTGSTLCGISKSIDLGTGTDIPGAANAPDAGVVGTPVGALANLDPTYLCGEVVSPTADSLRIEGLQNGVPYKVVFLVVDKYQNASGTFFTSAVTPVPSTDFWEDLHGRGSKAEGGLCLLAETYGDDSALTQALRAFRDDTLGGSRLGRWLTDAYYATLGKLGASVHGSITWRLVSAAALAPLVVLALLWHWLTLPGVLAALAAAWLWRRRRLLVRLGRRIRQMPSWLAALAIVTAVIVLAAPHAHAGGGYQPYWENGDELNDKQAAADDSQNVTWHVGIRVGPYVPDIDNQLGMNPGPYAQMFPGTFYMPMLDVDRILWTRFGQLGVGVSLGYLSRKDRTFVLGSAASDMSRPRASDVNRFRLIPTAVTATYRFTQLDDDYGIPVVPYVRAGLAYYIWWVSVSDHFARVCNDGMSIDQEPGCSTNRALGASLGVQGSIGLAIRAERIDSAAAISMRQSGIQHAGIYGELSLAKVDGFGSSTKLSVGDRTWFAGVNFEF